MKSAIYHTEKGTFLIETGKVKEFLLEDDYHITKPCMTVHVVSSENKGFNQSDPDDIRWFHECIFEKKGEAEKFVKW